jgi:hypothetical protein
VEAKARNHLTYSLGAVATKRMRGLTSPAHSCHITPKKPDLFLPELPIRENVVLVKRREHNAGIIALVGETGALSCSLVAASI